MQKVEPPENLQEKDDCAHVKSMADSFRESGLICSQMSKEERRENVKKLKEKQLENRDEIYYTDELIVNKLMKL